MRIAQVVIASPSRAVDREFHYLCPDGLGVREGQRVLVPFGRGDKTMEGVVIGFAARSGHDSLKTVLSVLDQRPLLPPSLISLALWLREHCLCTLYRAIKTIMPSGISVRTTEWITLIKPDAPSLGAAQKRVVGRLAAAGGTLDFAALSDIPSIRSVLAALAAKGVVSTEETASRGVSHRQIRMVELCGEADVALLYKRAPKQAVMLELLRQTGAVSVADLVSFSHGAYGAVNSLEKKGYVRFFDRIVPREVYDAESVERTHPLSPTPEQEAVLRSLLRRMERGDKQPSLLRGVTGSGKTEIFLQIIAAVLKRGQNAIVLVPEISLTPQMVSRFVGRFGGLVSVLHSAMSLGERYDQWTKILDGEVRVVVGARSAVFAPFASLGIIIVDEEHEGTYKSESVPFYDAREVALRRGEQEGALVLFSSATPSVTAFYRAREGEYRLYEMRQRHNRAEMPAVALVDMRGELRSGNKSVFSRLLGQRLAQTVQAGHQAILFHNRRGFNSFVLCRSCGGTLQCESCSVAMTYHKGADRLKCHHCGFEAAYPTQCPVCSSPHIRFMGTGTEKIEEELIRFFGKDSFIRMDADTTSGKHSHETILRRFERENIPILLGTQMVTKGLDFPNVTLVGVMAADLSLNMDDYRAAERTFSQLTQVCGRAGRGTLSGSAVVQTYQPEHYALRLARTHDYEGFYAHEIEMRRTLGLPPFCHIVLIMAQGRELEPVREALSQIAQALREAGGQSRILGPVSAPYAKIRGKHRWRVIVKCVDLEQIMPYLHKIIERPVKGDCTVTVDINPGSMN